MPRITVPFQLRWADLDANGHVNNVAYLTILEEVRIRALHPIIGALADEHGAIVRAGGAPVVVARHEIEYLRQMRWSPAPVRAEVWVSRVGRSSAEVCHRLLSPVDVPEEIYAHVISLLVYLDPESQQPRALTPRERASFATLTDEPLVLRGRAPGVRLPV